MENAKPKSRRLAGWLAILFGSLGVHNFYLGNKKRGFLHIFLFCSIFILPFIQQYALSADYDADIEYYNLILFSSVFFIPIFIANIIWSIFEGVLILLPKNSPTTAGVLSIFFGFLGVHDFYLGNNKKGFIHLFTLIISAFLIFIYSTFSRITDNPTLLKPLHYIPICFIVSDILWGVAEGFWLLNAKAKTVPQEKVFPEETIPLEMAQTETIQSTQAEMAQTTQAEVFETEITQTETDQAETTKIKLTQEKNHYWTILSLTFLTLIITFILKNFSYGVVTVLLIFIPVRAIAFLVAGTLFAKLKNRDTAGYILFAFSCLTSILFALFFSDSTCAYYCPAGEDHTVALIRGGGDFSNLCFIANILLSIAMFIYCNKKSHRRKHPKISSVSTSP